MNYMAICWSSMATLAHKSVAVFCYRKPSGNCVLQQCYVSEAVR